MSECYFEIMDDLSDRFGVPLLTHEYQIASVLIDMDCLSPKELFSYSRLSSTGFFNLLNQMVAKGALRCQQNGQDKRSKLYTLEDDVKAAILDQFRFYKSSSIDAFKSLGIENPEVSIQSRHKIHKLKVKHLTCELQILLYLYLNPGITNSQFVEIVGSSQTKFNATLRKLSGLGLIYFERDPSDRRKKLYNISAEVRQALTQMHERVYEWLSAKEEPQNCQPA